MSEHTETPWAAFKDPQTGNWFVVNSPSGLVCDMDGSGLTEEANARHIVRCVNNHERLVDALRAAMRFIDCHAADPDLSHEMIEAYSDLNRIDPNNILAQLDAEKGGE